MELTGKPVETVPDTDATPHALALTGWALLLAGALTLMFRTDPSWLGWAAVSAGALGIAALAVGVVLAALRRTNDFLGAGAVFGTLIVAGKFFHGAWQFLA